MSPTKNSANQRKAIAYIRVSSQRQVDEGVSIQAQKRRILEYVRYKKLNLANDDIFIEEGVSGGIPLWDRPKGRNLKRRLDTGQYTDIVTMKLDRMFRLTTDVLTTIDELNDAGIDLHIVDLNGEAVDTSTTMGRFFLTLMGALAEMERGLISERTTEAMNQLRATNKQFTKSIFRVGRQPQMECSFRIGLNRTSLTTWPGKLNTTGWRRQRWQGRSTNGA